LAFDAQAVPGAERRAAKSPGERTIGSFATAGRGNQSLVVSPEWGNL